MEFKRHSELKDKHSILSASKYQWLRYTDERLFEYIDNLRAAARGSRLHALAAEMIEMGIKPANTTQTFNSYVNDAIGYGLSAEVPLCYHQKYSFGTADAIGFRDKVLRIFDLKTGTGKAGLEQLVVYAAYFCLEYSISPYDIEFDLRIYQNDEIILIEVTAEEVLHAMSRIKELTALIVAKMEEV